jgi:hypothetical protein
MDIRPLSAIPFLAEKMKSGAGEYYDIRNRSFFGFHCPQKLDHLSTSLVVGAGICG